jgi:hypothetical protein
MTNEKHNLQMHVSHTNNQKAMIEQALEDYYFEGIRYGNLELLNKVFHQSSLLFGDVKGEPYAKTLAQYLNGVANRVSPANSGKPYETSILSVEVINSIAMAKVRLKMYEFTYYDLLSFHKIENRWVIVNKMLTHVDEDK